MMSSKIKRIIDVLLSSILIIILLPLLLVISILIRLDSLGPIFFKQERIGLNGVTFNILKFRTMVVNAENIGDGLSIKSSSDLRITKIGNILRKTSLDELPQLINVLIGSMSLVGPRPPVKYYPYNGFKNYPKWAARRFSFKPGITGLSQITVRNSVSWDNRIIVDLEYIDNFSILEDFKIMIKTIFSMIQRKHIY